MFVPAGLRSTENARDATAFSLLRMYPALFIRGQISRQPFYPKVA